MAVTLQTYIDRTRRILHDSQGEFWSNSSLIDYINEARRRVAGDTHVYRTIKTVTLQQDVDTYSFPAINGAVEVLDVMNIWVLYFSQRRPLEKMAFSRINQTYRYGMNIRQTPSAFAVYGKDTLYVAAIPNQDYESEWDCIYIPVDLVLVTDAEDMVVSHTDLVSYWASHLAQFEEKAYGESDRLATEYEYQKAKVLASRQPVSGRSIYSSSWRY